MNEREIVVGFLRMLKAQHEDCALCDLYTGLPLDDGEIVKLVEKYIREEG